MKQWISTTKPLQKKLKRWLPFFLAAGLLVFAILLSNFNAFKNNNISSLHVPWVTFTNSHGYRFQHPANIKLSGQDYGAVSSSESSTILMDDTLTIETYPLKQKSIGDCPKFTASSTVEEYAQHDWQINKEDSFKKTIGELEMLDIDGVTAYQFTATERLFSGCGGYRLINNETRIIYVKHGDYLFEIYLPTHNPTSDAILKSFMWQ